MLQHTDHTTDSPAWPALVAPAGCLDLIALPGSDTVELVRFNGQTAAAVRSGAAATAASTTTTSAPAASSAAAAVTALRWRDQALAVGYADGSVDALPVASGKVQQVLPPRGGAAGPVLGLSWTATSATEAATTTRPTPPTSATAPHSTANPVADAPDLPALLRGLDPAAVLPRLPAIRSPAGFDPLPAPYARLGPANPEILTDQLALDSFFGADQAGPGAATGRAAAASTLTATAPQPADILAVYTPSVATLVLSGSLLLGNVPWPAQYGPVRDVFDLPGPPGSPARLLAPVLAGPAGGDDDTLLFAPLDLGFLREAELLPVLAQTTQLQRVLGYICGAAGTATRAWRTADRQSRSCFGGPSVLAALQHLLLTGDSPPELAGWYETGEREFQRWETALGTAYGAVLELVHQAVLPGLDRLSVLAAGLRGRAAHFASPLLPANVAGGLAGVLARATAVRRAAHRLLVAAPAERAQFVAFAKWLRLALDGSSARAGQRERAREKEEGERDVGSALAFLSGPLRASRVGATLATGPEGGRAELAETAEGDRLWPQLHLLADAVAELAGGLTQLPLAQVTIPYGIYLDRGSIIAVDGRTVESEQATYVAVVKASRDVVYLHRLGHDGALDRAGSVSGCLATELRFPAGLVLDAKFASDEELLVLVRIGPGAGGGSQTAGVSAGGGTLLLSFAYAFGADADPDDPPGTGSGGAGVLRSNELAGLAAFTKPSRAVAAANAAAPVVPDNGLAVNSLAPYYARRGGTVAAVSFPGGQVDEPMMDRVDCVVDLERLLAVAVAREAAGREGEGGDGPGVFVRAFFPAEEGGYGEAGWTAVSRMRPGGGGGGEGEASLADLPDQDAFLPGALAVSEGRGFVVLTDVSGTRLRVLDLEQDEPDERRRRRERG